MMDSDGNAISVLEEALGEKRPARSIWEKYFCCCFYSKLLITFRG
tara:strand:+ start:473 stop:607 length:135 start_codon:yes stop_codon:yes gene_type:complete